MRAFAALALALSLSPPVVAAGEGPTEANPPLVGGSVEYYSGPDAVACPATILRVVPTNDPEVGLVTLEFDNGNRESTCPRRHRRSDRPAGPSWYRTTAED